jgi:hypothetical protein
MSKVMVASGNPHANPSRGLQPLYDFPAGEAFRHGYTLYVYRAGTVNDGRRPCLFHFSQNPEFLHRLRIKPL